MAVGERHDSTRRHESTRRHSEVARARERANGTPDKHCSWRESGGGKREKKHKPSSSSSESGPSIPPMPPIIEDMSMPPIPVQHRHTQSFSAAPVLLPSKPRNALPQPASYADSRAHVRKTSTPRPTSYQQPAGWHSMRNNTVQIKRAAFPTALHCTLPLFTTLSPCTECL